jgi:hypothetical protein
MASAALLMRPRLILQPRLPIQERTNRQLGDVPLVLVARPADLVPLVTIGRSFSFAA